jgi:hypothetical protein
MEIELNGAILKVFENGTIERFIYNKWRQLKGVEYKHYKYDYITHRTKINKKLYSTSRIIGYAYLGLDINSKTQIIDHIDRNPLNNILTNLRIVSHQQNTFNKISKGYSWSKRDNNWKAQIRVNYKKMYLGSYDTEEEARQAYLEAKAKYHII